MARILFLHTQFIPPGGGEAVAAWILEALKDRHDVTLLTAQPVDVAALNRYFGTSLQPGDFKVHYAPSWTAALCRLDPDPASIQLTCYLLRMCKRIIDQFDLAITDSMEADLGRPGIQYIHYPYMTRHHANVSHQFEPSWWRQVRGLATGRYRPWMLLAQYSFDKMKLNVTLANSEWTAEVYRQGYGAPAERLYPPVPGDFPTVPWQQKENAFACVGRFTPYKLEEAIAIMRQVRRRHPEIRLHLVGAREPVEPVFYRWLQRTGQSSDWLILHENCTRAEMCRLLAGIRYGLHAMRDEHFGIAVAELLKAGAIPFVHDSGGQVEIVGRRPELTFQTPADAEAKIDRVLGDPARQQELVGYLKARDGLFGTHQFVDGIRAAVDRVLDSRDRPAAAAA